MGASADWRPAGKGLPQHVVSPASVTVATTGDVSFALLCPERGSRRVPGATRLPAWPYALFQSVRPRSAKQRAAVTTMPELMANESVGACGYGGEQPLG